jgi:excisionase family DNA binding protein
MDDDESVAALAVGQLHDLDATARRLNISTRTVRRLIVRGELGFHRVGRLLRVSDAQYLEYLTRIKWGPRQVDNASILYSYRQSSSRPAILLAPYH